MKPEDLLPFDQSIIPWPTYTGEWALCITTEPEGRVWVEHKLIHDLIVAMQRDPEDKDIVHEFLVNVGSKMAFLLTAPQYNISNGKVLPIRFDWNPIEFRVGRFGGEIFVFLPKLEFEANRPKPEYTETPRWAAPS